MQDKAMLAWDKKYPPGQLNPRIAGWREAHPDGTLEDAVRDLGLWHIPQDPDAQRLVWYRLRDLGDPAALEGFQAMRADAARKLRGPAQSAVPAAGPSHPGSAR
jgi:hypothetical protein